MAILGSINPLLSAGLEGADAWRLDAYVRRGGYKALKKILAEKLNISKHQISFVNNSNAGEGLLFYGNVIIPFADRYPQDTRTYALMSTKPDEIQT